MQFNYKSGLKVLTDLAYGTLDLKRYSNKHLYIWVLLDQLIYLEKFIREEWHTLDNNDKEVITQVAYAVLAEEERLPVFRAQYFYKIFRLQGFNRKDAVRRLLDNYQDCLDEILSQIERDDPRFQAELEESLNQAIEYLNNYK